MIYHSGRQPIMFESTAEPSNKLSCTTALYNRTQRTSFGVTAKGLFLLGSEVRDGTSPQFSEEKSAVAVTKTWQYASTLYKLWTYELKGQPFHAGVGVKLS